jgi:hypothetical protein
VDFFGIGIAMQGMARVLWQTSRRTGRTTQLLDALKDGDRVIFSKASHRQYFKRGCRDRGLDVELVVMPVNDIKLLGTVQGKTYFDHTWVQDMYEYALNKVEREIDHKERQMSGYGEAHIKTRKQAEALMRWES